MKFLTQIFFISFLLFAFNVSDSDIETNRSLLLLQPEQFFRHEYSNLQIDLRNPNDNLLTVSIFQATNLLRKKKGRKMFKPDYALHLAGLDHIGAMNRHKFFGHRNPYNSRQTDFRKRIENRGGKFYIVAENLALVHPFKTKNDQYRYRVINSRYYYFDMNGRPLRPMTYGELGKSIVTDWYNSKGHRANLLARELTHLGVAAKITKMNYGRKKLPDVYAVQEFGAY